MQNKKNLGGRQMQIVEYATCSACGKSYKGVFTVQVTGDIYCKSCENPVMVPKEIEWEEASPNNEEHLYRRVSDMLVRDIQFLNHLQAVGDDEYVGTVMKDGSPIPEKLYFMGNPIELAETGHKAVYACIPYLDTGDKEYETVAETVVMSYLSLREKRLTKDEEEKFWGVLESPEMNTIYQEFG